LYCPRGHKEMAVKRTKKNVLFRDVRLSIPVEQFVCPECGVEAGRVVTEGCNGVVRLDKNYHFIAEI